IGITPSQSHYDPSLRQPGDLNLLLSELIVATETDDQGKFSLDNLPKDHRVAAWVQRPGYHWQSFVIDTGKSADPAEIPAIMGGSNIERTRLMRSPLSLRLEPAKGLEVTVLDPDGKPAHEAVVMTFDSPGWGTRLDDSGKAWFEVRKDGMHRILSSSDP